jgi:3',5'-nucleoside bisphosphate phosphatase
LGICDFHVHSTASDGRLSPSELVDEAAESGLDALAIADHDTTDGLQEAVSRAEERGVFLVPAVELSVNLHTGGSAHLLGYFPGQSPAVLNDRDSQLERALEIVRAGRNHRNPEIVKRLNELGIPVTMEEVEAEAGGTVTGRPHIAAVVVKKGYAHDPAEVFDRYLASGRPGYVERERIGDFRAIEVIRQSGGLPVLAHPAYIPTGSRKALDALISSLADAGLGGLEAFYPEHSSEMVAFLSNAARKRKLFLTGGSDFHGIKHPRPCWQEGLFGVNTEDVTDFFSLCRSMGGKA